MFINSLLYLALASGLKGAGTVGLNTVIAVYKNMVTTFAGRGSLVVKDVNLFLCFTFIRFTARTYVSLYASMETRVHKAMVNSDFNTLTVNDAVKANISPILCAGFKCAPYVVMNAIVMTVTLLIVTGILAPNFTGGRGG